MSSLIRELVFVVLQFLDEQKFSGSVHRLEQESGYFFNMSYFENLVMNGEWDEIEKYLSGFTKLDDNRFSKKVFFEIRKQKYLEALDRNDRPTAVDILMKDLKVFSTFDEGLFKEMTALLTLENFRQNEKLSTYGDTKFHRSNLFEEAQRMIEANPLFREKLNFPSLKNSRLRTLINQSLNWQHQVCKNPKPNPEIETLFVDHSCGQSHKNGAQTSSPITTTIFGTTVPNPGGFLPLGAHSPSQPELSPLPTSRTGLMSNAQGPHSSVSAGPIGLSPNNTATVLKRVRAPASDTAVGVCQTAESEHVLKRPRTFGMSDENGHNQNLVDLKSRMADEPTDSTRIWKLMKINESSNCQSLRLPDNLAATKVIRLMYTNYGNAILALSANAVHKLWVLPKNERYTSGKASAGVLLQLWKQASGISMTNDISDTDPKDVVPCFALSKNEHYVLSASGGKISVFNMVAYKTMTTCMAPPPAVTSLAFHPQDNNVIVVGMADATIQIYNIPLDEVKNKLTGHQKRITGLAFSNTLNVLLSSGADSQLCVWSTDVWEKKSSTYLQTPGHGHCAAAPLADTSVQFHQDQEHFLVARETQIAIYEVNNLECLKQWAPQEASGRITCATYSCDSLSIYVSFEDGSLGVLTAATLQLRCQIDPSAYLPTNPSSKAYPLVIAAHPTECNQFAVGLSDGGVHVLKPIESEGKWGTSPPLENDDGSSASGSATQIIYKGSTLEH